MLPSTRVAPTTPSRWAGRRSLPLGPRPPRGRGALATERERQGDHAPAAAHARVDQNLVLARSGQINENGEYWVEVRLPILPNGSTGWVPRNALGAFHRDLDAARHRPQAVHGDALPARHCDLPDPGRRRQAVLADPAGEFYVREQITGFWDLIYGPIAFGTNGRSAVLTDWPGGGFIGIHGTNQPEILPGQVSHGCVRMPNSAVRRLSRLMPLGTPVTIT